MFGLYPILIQWIGSFLSDRSIGFRVDGFLSNLHSINAGVPQCSVISPVLFILFINDLLTSTSSVIHSFAKDASQKLGFLVRARGFFSSSYLSIYNSQIHPSLEYCSTSGVVLQNLLSVFLTKSSPKPFASSIILTSPNLSNLFPIVV